MINYQDLNLKALKDLLRDRNIAGRSKATTKEKAIALLEECDRLSAENLPAPVENFTGSPPPPPAPPIPEPEPEPADESEYTDGVRCPKCAQCGSFETWSERDGGYWCENCNYQFTPPAPPEPELKLEQDNSQPCLSIRQPWAWAIFHLGKDVENRSWQPPRLGRIYIHASKTYDHAGAAWIEKTFGVRPPGPDDLPMGAIVGSVEVVGCTQNSVSSWAIAGQFHWQLNKPVEISPISCPGELGIFYRHIPSDLKAECLKATFEKAAKLKSLIDNQKINRRERIETSITQSPSGAVVNNVASTASIAESIPQSFNDVKTTDNDENNSDSAEKLAEQIWRSSLEFIDYHGQPAKRVSLAQAEILFGLSPESSYRLIIFEHGQGIVMSPAPASPSPSPPAPAPSKSERHAKAKAEYHRLYPQEFPNIQIFERSPNNQWYEHRLVRAAKNKFEPSIYEVIPVNPIDLSPRSPPCTA